MQLSVNCSKLCLMISIMYSYLLILIGSALTTRGAKLGVIVTYGEEWSKDVIDLYFFISEE